MKLLPFDLEKAKAGARVVTRDGQPIKEIFFTKEPLKKGEVAIAIHSDNCGRVHHSNGGFYEAEESLYDLFLAQEPYAYVVEHNDCAVAFFKSRDKAIEWAENEGKLVELYK